MPAASQAPSLRLAAVAILAGLAATACAPPPSPEPAEQRPLRIGLRDAPLSLDPHLRNEVLTISVLSNVYEALTGFDPNGRVQPMLVERWENPDDLTWRFDLRPGVSFHDGSALDAADVVFSVRRAKEHPETNFSNFLVEVETVRAVDELAVEIVTAHPYPILLNKLAFVAIVPDGSPAEITDPIGTGPYRLDSFRAGEPLTLRAFEGYRSAPASEKVVEIRIVPESDDRLSKLIAGELDLVHEIPPKAADELAEEPCCYALSRDSLQIEYLAADPTAAPFDDPAVRAAIDLALDRRELVDAMTHGHGQPLNQLAALNVFGYDPEIAPPPGDAKAARALLAEAGYPEGLEIEIELREGRDVGHIAAQLAEAGITLRSVVRPWPEMYERLIAGEVDFYIGGIVAVSADASDILDALAHSKGTLPGYGEHNDFGYANPEVDRLVELSGSTLDMLERRAIIGQVIRLVMEDKVILPLYSPNEIYGIRRGLEWQPRLDGMMRAYEMRRREIDG